jgi:hypothetical protein
VNADIGRQPGSAMSRHMALQHIRRRSAPSGANEHADEM